MTWEAVGDFLYLDGRSIGNVGPVGFGQTPLEDVVKRANEGDGVADMALQWHAEMFVERQIARAMEALR